MGADNADGRGPRARFEGFHSYADDTPRGVGADDADGHGPPACFEGFHSYADDTPLQDADDSAYASAEADWRSEDIPRRRPGWLPGSFIVAAGLALAVAGGFWLGRVLPDPGAERAPVAATAAPTAPRAQMDVEVAHVAPAPPPVTGDRLEVLPPDVALPAHDLAPPTGRAADTATAAPGSLPPTTTAPGPPETLTIPPPPRVEPARVEPQRVDPPRIAPTAPAPRELADGAPRTSYDCRAAPSRARAMVCADPRLAALDQQMRRAYDAALAAGVPEADLRADQADWLDIREDAARYSRSAVTQIYRQRIEELRMMLQN